MIIIDQFKQGDEDWFRACAGNPGASSFDQILTSTGKISASRPKLLYQMAGEKVIGTKGESFSTPFMERGIQLEAEARSLFEFMNDVSVRQVALVHPDHDQRYHASPDGLINDTKSGLEIKCPSLPVAVEYIDKGKLPTKYKVQVQGSMMVTGYDSWFFMSYYPGLNPFIVEVERDEKFIALLQEAVEEFCDDLDKMAMRLAA